MEVPSIGSPDEDPKTVELKLRQVQKEKGKMKVRLFAITCVGIVLLGCGFVVFLPLLSCSACCAYLVL